MSDNQKPTIFSASKLFRSFSSEIIWTPTSILDIKSLSVIKHPFFSKKKNKNPHWTNKDSNSVGLGLVDGLTTCNNSDDRSLYSRSKMIVFGSQLKIQIPEIESSLSSSVGSAESPYSPIEFGINNKDSQLALLSPDLSSESLPLSPGFFTREMELLEEYTCVISHGPNPKKTHIFDNYVMENCDNDFAMEKKENRVFSENSSDFPSSDFLSSCHACNKPLVNKDIFMYRGEIAFCSRECRQQELISDDELRSALL